MLRRRRLNVVKYTNTAEALPFVLERGCDGKEEGWVALLDVILPRTDEGASLSPFMGLELARISCEAGAEGIALLSVISAGDVAAEVGLLRKRFSTVPIRFFDKLTLLDVGGLDELVSFLRSPSEFPEGER
jgi:hypothetical protein